MTALKKSPWLVAAAGALVVLGLWYLLLWGPQGVALADAESRAMQANDRLTALELQRTRLQANRRSPDKSDRAAKLMSAIPEDPQLAELILALNDAAANSGVSLTNIAPVAAQPEKKAVTTTTSAGSGSASRATTTVASASGANASKGGPYASQVTLGITGSYEQVLSFLDRVRAMPRLAVQDTLSMSANQDGSLNAQATVRVFSTATPVAKGATK